MNNKIDIQNWIKRVAGQDCLFITIRFDTAPKTIYELCRRCFPVFRLLFLKTLGRRWFKLYKKHFRLIGIQEYGQKGNMHAHFLLGTKCPAQTIKTIKSLAGILKMDIWENYEDKVNNPKRYFNDIMITKVFSDGVFIYTTKEIKTPNPLTRVNSDVIILDTDIFH